MIRNQHDTAPDDCRIHSAERKIKVLVVDDSAIVRHILSETLSACPDIESVSTAPDAFVARSKILLENPDVLTLDLEMPGMDGLTFLKKLMHYHPMPVVVISSLAQTGCAPALEAMRLGAVEVLPKPHGPYSVADLKVDLPRKILAAAQARIFSAPRMPVKPASTEPGLLRAPAVIAIGASTGGVQAIEAILKDLGANCPGMVIAQHIPEFFSAAFANRLDQLCRMQVREAADDDIVAAGRVLVAPGNRHLLLRRVAGSYRVVLSDAPRVCYQRPSVDVLFESVAEAAGSDATGVLLTGMGSDGAKGLLKMKQRGARTLAQDEKSCVVFGMPREAIQAGAVDHVLPLSDIAAALSRG